MRLETCAVAAARSRACSCASAKVLWRWRSVNGPFAFLKDRHANQAANRGKDYEDYKANDASDYQKNDTR